MIFNKTKNITFGTKPNEKSLHFIVKNICCRFLFFTLSFHVKLLQELCCAAYWEILDNKYSEIRLKQVIKYYDCIFLLLLGVIINI